MYEHPTDVLDILFCGKVSCDILHGYTQQCTLDDTVFAKIIHHLLCNAAWNSKGITAIGACTGSNGGIDTYQFTFGVNQGTTGITGIHGSICLDKSLYFEFPIVGGQTAAFSTDNPGCYG